MDTIIRHCRRWFFVLLCSAASPPTLAELKGVQAVLGHIDKAPDSAAPTPDSAPVALLKDIRAYRIASHDMEPARAAQQWFALVDRGFVTSKPVGQPDLRAFDTDIMAMVGLRSVLASLPPPSAWKALGIEAVKRCKKKPVDIRNLELKLLTDLLNGDRSAAAKSLADIDAAANQQQPDERERLQRALTGMRIELSSLYGSSSEVAASFETLSLDNATREMFNDVEVPDLVGLVGAVRAEEILRKALLKPVKLHVKDGDATRLLARKLALDQVNNLRVPQWGLADSLDAAPLYEALQKRFRGGASSTPSGPAEETGEDRFDFQKSTADVYYFLAMVIAHRQPEAESSLLSIRADDQLFVPRQAIDALQRLNQNEALYEFLNALLPRHPEVRAWKLYVEQAAYTGHAADSLKTIDALLARKDLPPFVAAELKKHRVSALLATDAVDSAIKVLRADLSAAPRHDEPELQGRIDEAIGLAKLGRVLGRKDLSRTSLDFLRQALALEGAGTRQRPETLRAALAELRKLGDAEGAQLLAVRELEHLGEAANPLEQLDPRRIPPTQRVAMIELAGIYGAAGRDSDVLTLLRQSTRWGVRDLGELLKEKDSLGDPVALIVARSLAATGDRDTAKSLVAALLDTFPGYDPGYELLVALDGDSAISNLDQRYAKDPFEERPLIWKASLLLKRGALSDARKSAEAAIATDPSDGEEGPGDRMRAYAVLADILQAAGDTNAAGQYRSAVAAIRMSEHSDELHEAGLLQRAFAGYREALNSFADAYCIQSRLAIQLNEQGHHQEALEHYRRAYELMPDSFGRMESHCLGCEGAFQGPEQQTIAEQVFTDLLKKQPEKAQVHYMLAYLREQEGRYDEALQPLREAVAIDPGYLNAWKHLHDLAEHIYLEPSERDIARLKLLALDSSHRHVQYEINEVGDLKMLWGALDKARSNGTAGHHDLFKLEQSAAKYGSLVSKLPDAVRQQIQLFETLTGDAQDNEKSVSPQRGIARHSLVVQWEALAERSPGYDLD